MGRVKLQYYFLYELPPQGKLHGWLLETSKRGESLGLGLGLTGASPYYIYAIDRDCYLGWINILKVWRGKVDESILNSRDTRRSTPLHSAMPISFRSSFPLSVRVHTCEITIETRNEVAV